jgi:hypothetical protein
VFRLEDLEPAQLEKMLVAGAEIQNCNRVLHRVEANVVSEVISDGGTFYEWDHYPDGDVFDHDSHSQYYYHSHRPEEGEHGHFHVFRRGEAFPEDFAMAENTSEEPWPQDDEMVTHLIGISMDPQGFPIRLFTANRWVTGENWFAAEAVIKMLDHYEIDHAWPSWPTNRWITAMLVLFRPQIENLVHERDAKIAEWAEKDLAEHVFEDRELEITSVLAINVERHINDIKKTLKQKSA